jgi:hypothetical protein
VNLKVPNEDLTSEREVKIHHLEDALVGKTNMENSFK